MNCETYRSELIEVARGGTPASGLAGHLATCAACSERLDMQLGLTASMARAASESSRIGLPAGAESALLAEFIRARKPKVRVMPRWAAIAGLAAAVALAAVLFNSAAPQKQSVRGNVPTPVASSVAVQPEPAQQPLVTARHTARKSVTPAPEPEQPFIEVPYTMPLEPFERAQMMQVELPVSALIAAGMPVGAADPAAHARADVIVGQDGRARAFRVISVATFNTDRSF